MNFSSFSYLLLGSFNDRLGRRVQGVCRVSNALWDGFSLFGPNDFMLSIHVVNVV